MLAVPFRTISTTVFQALGESLSVGDTKFPAALLMIMSGRPSLSTHSSTAAVTCAGSLTSAATVRTWEMSRGQISYMGYAAKRTLPSGMGGGEGWKDSHMKRSGMLVACYHINRGQNLGFWYHLWCKTSDSNILILTRYHWGAPVSVKLTSATKWRHYETCIFSDSGCCRAWYLLQLVEKGLNHTLFSQQELLTSIPDLFIQESLPPSPRDYPSAWGRGTQHQLLGHSPHSTSFPVMPEISSAVFTSTSSFLKVKTKHEWCWHWSFHCP